MSAKGTKHWSEYGKGKLRTLWPKHSRAEIMKNFPGRSWAAIEQKANGMGLKRNVGKKYRRSPTKDNLMAALRYAREQLDMPADKIGQHIGVTPKLIARYERGTNYPRLPTLLRWCAFLGQELTVKPARSANV